MTGLRGRLREFRPLRNHRLAQAWDWKNHSQTYSFNTFDASRDGAAETIILDGSIRYIYTHTAIRCYRGTK